MLDDEKFRISYEHPDIIKCIDCEHNVNGYCSNQYSYPEIKGYDGCKNGRIIKKDIELKKYSFLDKIKCKLGLHKEHWLGKSNPYPNEILMKCTCCNKYGLYNMNMQCTFWFNKKDIGKYVKSKSCLEMIDKYRL